MLDVSYKITLLMVALWSEIRCREHCFWESSPRIFSKTKRIEASCTTLSWEIKASFMSKTLASFLDDGSFSCVWSSKWLPTNEPDKDSQSFSVNLWRYLASTSYTFAYRNQLMWDSLTAIILEGSSTSSTAFSSCCLCSALESGIPRIITFLREMQVVM